MRSWTSFAGRYCPVIARLGASYDWSVDQTEYATDIGFRRQADLQAIYENLTRTAIHAVKPAGDFRNQRRTGGSSLEKVRRPGDYVM
jgi:hypothetical protein